MKHVLCWLLLALLSAGSCLAQPNRRSALAKEGVSQTPDTAAVHINRLLPSGLLLQKGWRYHAGDDLAWARPDFDDSRWDTLNPTRPRRELPPALSTGIGWLRLRFRLGDSLRQRALLLLNNGNGAWELYLDGQLLQRDGTLHPDPSRVQVNPNTPEPLELPGTGRAAHVLAVRFAPWHYPLLQKVINELLRIHFSDTDTDCAGAGHARRSVKEVTGKPTTSHIADRVISEAKALLHHTSWDVAEIAQSLGFEYASYFNNFFKKHPGSTPLPFRKAV